MLLLFVAWELWWTNSDADRSQDELAARTLHDFPGDPQSTPAGPVDPAEAAPVDRERHGTPPVTPMDGVGAIGVLYIPRFGKNYGRPISQGVGSDVLDHLGIGHYPGTQGPAERGNFAIAAHRQTHGQVFWDIDKLSHGDYLYLQTREGHYTYRYRTTKIVHPSASEVLLPVPYQAENQATESLMTMTSCDPPFTTHMRIIVSAQLHFWRPLDAGPPPPVAEAVSRAAGTDRTRHQPTTLNQPSQGVAACTPGY